MIIIIIIIIIIVIIIMVAVKELVERRHRDVLKKMQRACLSVTLNIARTFKVATH